MLTADLVAARRQGSELRVVPLDARTRVRALELATEFVQLARAHLGCSRLEFESACAAVPVSARERLLSAGLRKLLEDRCDFGAESPLDPEALRKEVFLRAAATRRQGGFARQALVDELASGHAVSAETLERALYSDLRDAHLLAALAPIRPEDLVAEYDLAQQQAVLLRAVRVVVEVECDTPGSYRALFHKLKFLRLLYSLTRSPTGGYRIEIDGPYSLFESVTKYGLELALVLPALREFASFTLQADIRWGKERVPLTFKLDGQKRSPAALALPPRRLPDEVAALLDGLRILPTAWNARPASELLDLPGVGLCVPDLVFEHPETGACVFLEVLGFWSREAVWRRVELVQAGLGQRILFAVSKHLRVSEDVLDDELPGALYVYKRKLHAKTILERVERLAESGY
jgi:predicted nuclease of restriction endonuclease-like RecB superfamily